jgi:hypothetical protein
MEKCCVFFEVRTEHFLKYYLDEVLQRTKYEA